MQHLLSPVFISTFQVGNSGCYGNTAKYLLNRSQFICVFWSLSIMVANCVSVFLSQLNGAEATPGTYSASKMTAGCYQRVMQQFTGALQGGGLGIWLRKPPELGHFNINVWKSVLNSEYWRLKWRSCMLFFVSAWVRNKDCHSRQRRRLGISLLFILNEELLTVWKWHHWSDSGQTSKEFSIMQISKE